MNLDTKFCSFLHHLLSLTQLCYTFILPRNIGNISSQNILFISDWLVKTGKLHVISNLLVEDVDLDGNLDVYFSTSDGTLYGVSNVLKCSTVKPCSAHHENWPVTHHGEVFFSSPHAVDVYADGLKSVLFISYHGAVFTYDYHGNLLSHFQIPDIILDRSILSRRNPDKNLFESIRWASTDNQLLDIRLHPIVYTDPIILTSLIVPSNMNDIDFFYVDFLHIALNFITYDPHITTTSLNESFSSDEGVLVAAIVNIPRCALLYLPKKDSKLCSLRLKVLEVDWLSVKFPPYVFSSPTINANVLEETRVKDHLYVDSYYSFITTFSGNIHVVQLSMLNSHGGQLSPDVNDIFIDSYSLHVTPMTLSCVPSPCPLIKMKSNLLQSNVHTCCLQVDIYSCLRLIRLVPIKKYHSQVYWTYCPTNTTTITKSFEYGEQIGQVTIVPGCQKFQTCSPWSVYTTPDGYAHAVEIQTGLSAPGYPVSLSTMNYNVTNLSIGSGLLYQSEDFTYWLLFTDVYANLIHLRLHNPLVIISINHDSILHNHQSNSLQTISLSPKPIRLQAGALTSPSYLLLSNYGLLLLKSKSSPYIVQRNSTSLLTYSKYIVNVNKSVAQLMNPFQFISAQFVNDYLEPVDSVIFDDNKRTLNYLIRDCSYQLNLLNESHLAKRFLVRLFTSFGVPISEWSNAYVTKNSACLSSCKCSTGSLSIQHSLPSGSYRSELYLSVIDTTNGYFIVNYPMLTGSTEIASRIMLHIGLYQTQLIVSLIYLPGVYLFIGLTMIHWFSILTTKQTLNMHGKMKQSI
ncbi:unnamed protein product [Schistosoma turkestanicum]|nr:unnamed protein product [Schistosoma turkestanicum]